MPLPATGPISMNDVNVELVLSATAQISLNDTIVRTLFNKSSGAISLDDGHVKSAIVISNKSALSTTINPTNATAQYELRSDGTLYMTESNNTLVSQAGEWLIAAAASSFEARVLTSSLSGSPGTFLSSPALDTWHALSTTRTWQRDRTSIGQNNVTFTVEIRRTSDNLVVDSGVIVLTAIKEAGA